MADNPVFSNNQNGQPSDRIRWDDSRTFRAIFDTTEQFRPREYSVPSIKSTDSLNMNVMRKEDRSHSVMNCPHRRRTSSCTSGGNTFSHQNGAGFGNVSKNGLSPGLKSFPAVSENESDEISESLWREQWSQFIRHTTFHGWRFIVDDTPFIARRYSTVTCVVKTSILFSSPLLLLTATQL